MDLNLNGARIGETSVPNSYRPILLPFQNKPITHFSMDIGGSLAKMVYFEPNEVADNGQGGRLNFIKFETRNMDDFLNFITKGVPKVVDITGGGAFKYADLLEKALGVELNKEDEMKALITGLNFLLLNVPNESFMYSTIPRDPNPKTFVPIKDPFPYLLVNIGSGVSIVKVESETSFQRVDGTSLGGGTFYGLCSLLTGLTNFDEMLQCTTEGDSNKVDLVVGDIYGTDYNKVGLAADVIASSFGKILYKEKLNLSFTKADLALSLLKMMCNNIGQIAYLDAQRHGLTRIYFGGFFIRDHPDTMQRISFAVNFWSKGKIQAMFLSHEGYLGALGAFLSNQNAQPAVPVSNGMYQKSKEWIQKMLQSLQVKQQEIAVPECACGAKFCEGVVCKHKNSEQDKDNKK